MPAALAQGTRIGGFELDGVIGRGGFGVTYRAREHRSGRLYAIKEYLPAEFAHRDATGLVTGRPGRQDGYERGKAAFMTEANILKDLPRREGLVRVRGAFERSGTAYCVMEFIEGDSLDRLANRMIGKLGHVPEPLLLELALSVLWALDALHAAHVIHRDVKPANIMLRRSGGPVVIDFGAARRLTRAGDAHAMLTRSYAALEQFPPERSGFERRFEEGAWSDLYALSVVLHELIAHGLPPDALTRAETVLAGRPDPYVPLARRIEGTPRAGLYSEALLDAVDAGCALMPQARPRTARDMAERLSPGTWTSMAEAERGRSRGPARGRGGARRWAVVALAALATGGGLFLLLGWEPGTERIR